MEGVECRTHANLSLTEAYLQATPAAMQRYVGQPLASLRIIGVETRDMTSTSGQAEVEYGLRTATAGNDNWVTYHLGGSKAANCHAPIGGESSTSPSGSAP